MATFITDQRRWIVEAGDLAYWVNDDDTLSRCRVELITGEWVYVKFLAADHGRQPGQVDRASRFNRRIVPRDAVRAKVGAGQRLRSPVMWEAILTGPATA
ncbi:hypothetical protein FHR83_007082 [Actinoplanes campanulatus]|uniref:Uncharacterized protein n=1 Tax=Actinoplanes campanulatus TaxID=113559 RepID=A0A7W5AN66_9ACTN|nr:hypothetical protein [Actinoplanes campanulatus]MBB3099376.1 hypothetical protein [Actinoplanes campanulatus]GGN40235.1 hypothetical protein GCM10010109_69100 [Actinoplanes campanulatus]GID42415.1 hypothetical protein Aca09nite_89210 [Actinoplanes campanulatus]